MCSQNFHTAWLPITARGLRVSVFPRRECAMELLSEVESLCDSLFWDRADVGKRLASLRKLQTAVTCEGAPRPAMLPPPTRI